MRDEIIREIKKLGEKLGRAPSQAEFRRETKISWHQVYKHFRGMRTAVRAAGLEPGPRGGPLAEQALVLDWARVVRELGRLPSRAEYDARGKHHSVTLHARVGWHQMAHRFVLLIREFHLEREWADVEQIVLRKYPLLERSIHRSAISLQPQDIWAEDRLKLERDRFIGPSGHRITTPANQGPACWGPREVGNPEPSGRELTRMDAKRGMRLGRVVAAALAVQILMATAVNGQTKAAAPVVYGEPLGLAAMAHAPTCEDGVLFLFGVLAADMGFRIERIQKAFPDVEAKREVAPGRWELQLLELELYSRNFKEHRHDPTKCHGIVCWKHNWPDCPEWLEVIELSKAVKGR